VRVCIASFMNFKTLGRSGFLSRFEWPLRAYERLSYRSLAAADLRPCGGHSHCAFYLLTPVNKLMSICFLRWPDRQLRFQGLERGLSRFLREHGPHAMSGAEAILGVVSGGAGLLSLAIQLGESARKLKSFHDSMRNAPETLKDLEFDLQTMALSLQQLERDRQRNSHDAVLLARCIERCQRCTDKIGRALDKMSKYTARNARLGKVYTAFKEKDIDKLLADLELAKSLLQLSLMMYWSEQHEERHRDQAAHTGSSIALLTSGGEDTHSVKQRAMAVPARRVRRGSKALKIQVATRLLAWLTSKIWNLAVCESIGGWNISICSYNIRPTESAIFRCCDNGNLAMVQRLIQGGDASLSDVDEYGRSLIEVR